MKKLLFKSFILLLITIVACSKSDEIVQEESVNYQKDPLSISEINSKISETLSTKGNFNWSNTDAHFLWSALVHGNNILTVGYGSENEIFSENRSQSLINKKDELVSLISKNEKISKDKLTIVEHQIINVFDIEVKSIETIIAFQ